jgi:hypothetical protein
MSWTLFVLVDHMLQYVRSLGHNVLLPTYTHH